MGVRGLLALRHADRHSHDARKSAGGFITALVIGFGVSGDNLAVYIPIFRVGDVADGAVTVGVFAALELLLCILATKLGRSPTMLRALDRMGAYAIPVLYLAIGLLVLVRAHTFGL
jgi:cadmium resistance protein CadD (predicted permease)